MNLKDIMLHKITKTEKDKILYDLTFMRNLNIKNQIYRNGVEWWLSGLWGQRK